MNDAMGNLGAIMEGTMALAELSNAMSMDEMEKMSEYMESLTNKDDKNALLIAIAKDKKGAAISDAEKTQLDAFKTAVYGSATGKPSGYVPGAEEMKDMMVGKKILDTRRETMTEQEKLEMTTYFKTLSKEEQAIYLVAVAKESRGEELSGEQATALKSGNSNGEDSGFTFVMAGTAAVCASFLL